MTSRGHRSPEQREGLGSYLLDPGLCSVSKWEAVSFKNISGHSPGLLRAGDSGDGSCVSSESHTQASSGPRFLSSLSEHMIWTEIIQSCKHSSSEAAGKQNAAPHQSVWCHLLDSSRSQSMPHCPGSV